MIGVILLLAIVVVVSVVIRASLKSSMRRERALRNAPYEEGD